MDEAINAFKSTACFRELQDVITKFQKGDTAIGNVETKDAILDILLKHKYAEQRVLHCKQVGAWPGNRGGEGLLWRRAHSRLMIIKTSGFSERAIAHNAVAGEDNPYTREYAKFTVKLTGSHPQYAKYREEELVAGAWGATHAMHAFACVLDGVPTDLQSISKNGRIHRETVLENDVSGNFAHALDVGVNFVLVRWVVHAALPLVQDIVGSALNTVQQTSEGPFRLRR